MTDNEITQLRERLLDQERRWTDTLNKLRAMLTGIRELHAKLEKLERDMTGVPDPNATTSTTAY
jgi:hypothetical protein